MMTSRAAVTAPLVVLLVILSQVKQIDSTATLVFNITSYTPPDTLNIINNVASCSGTCPNVTFVTCFSRSPIQSCSGLPQQVFYGLPSVVYPLDSWTGQLYTIITTVCPSPTPVFIDTFTYINSALQGPVVGSLVGLYTNFSLSYSASTTCDPTFYGPNCTRSCVPTDSCLGHYTCDPLTGNKVCLPHWIGASCTEPEQTPVPPCPFVPPAPISNSNCSLIDLIFVVYNAPSSGDLWNTSKELIRSFVQRVTVGTTGYQLGVVTYSDLAQLAIPLQSNASMFLTDVDRLAPSIGSGVNLRRALYVTRTTALAFSSGARPPAYKAVVLVWNGIPPDVQFGLVTNEAPLLTQSGVDVYIVTTSMFGSLGSTQQLATSIASRANNIFVVGQDQSTSSVSASIAVGITLNCQRSNSSSLPSTSTATRTADGCCNYRGTWNPDKNTCCCTIGFAGNYCEYTVDPCNGNPCNVGQCIRSGTIDYNCDCPPGFFGINCQLVGSGAINVSFPSSPSCSSSCSSSPCSPNFYGQPNCTIFCQRTDTCSGHYDCNPITGSKICLPGWGGDQCNVSTSSNTSNCCESGGKWLNGVCCCPAGAVNCTSGSSITLTSIVSVTQAITTATTAASFNTTSRATVTDISVTFTNMMSAPLGSVTTPFAGTGSTVTGTVVTGSAGTTTPLSSVSTPANTGSTVNETVVTGSAGTTTTPLSSVSTPANTGSTVNETVVTGSAGTTTTPLSSVSTPANTGSTVTGTVVTGSAGTTLPGSSISGTVIPSSATTAIADSSATTSTSTSTLSTAATTSPVVTATASSIVASITTTGVSTAGESTMAGSTQPTLTSGALSTPVASTQTTITMTTTSQPPMTTTTSLAEGLLDFIRRTFPFLSEDEQLQLFNVLFQLSQSNTAAARAQRTPIWTSSSFPGTGGWINYTIRIEVYSFYVNPANPSSMFFLDYVYVVTDSTGGERRVTPDEYNSQLAAGNNTTNSTSSGNNSSSDSSQFNISNQLSVTFYGVFFDPLQQSLISKALKAVYGLFNPAWNALNESRVVMAQPDELVEPNGVSLTRCKFWLVNGTNTTQLPAQVTQPNSDEIAKALVSVGIQTSVFNSSVYFNVIDGFKLYVVGVVQDRDIPAFKNVFTSVWNNISSAYSSRSIVILSQDRYFTDNGTLLTRLVYYFYTGSLNGSSFVSLSKAGLGVSSPVSEIYVPYLQLTNFTSGKMYTLLSAASTETLWGVQEAFRLLTLERPFTTGLSAIEIQLQSTVATAFNSSNYTTRAIYYEQVFSEQKMTTFYRVYWFVLNNGIVLDARTVNNIVESSIQLNVTLPSGLPLTVINDNTISDTLVTLSSCFQLFSNSTMLRYGDLKQAITTSLLGKYRESFNSSQFNVTVSIVGNEQFIIISSSSSSSSQQSSLSSFYYVIKLIYANYVEYIDASAVPELSLDAGDISNVTGLVSSSAVMMQGFVSDSYEWSVILTTRPLRPAIDQILANITAVLNARFSVDSVNLTFTRIEECKIANRPGSVWKFGFTVRIDGIYRFSGEISSVALVNISVALQRGATFTVITDLSVIKSLVRVSDLFMLNLNLPVSVTIFDVINSNFSAAFQMLYSGQWESVKASIVSMDEVIPCQRCANSYRYYIRVVSSLWNLSPRRLPPLPVSVANSLIGSFKTPKGLPYVLLPPAPPAGGPVPEAVLLSQVFGVIFFNPVLDTDITVVQLALQTLLQSKLPPAVPGGPGLVVRYVQQSAVQVCITETCDSLLPLPTCPGSGPCSLSQWEIRFTAAIGTELIDSKIGLINLISYLELQNALSSASVPYKVGLTDYKGAIDVNKGLTLSFPSPPSPQKLEQIVSVLQGVYQADFPGSIVNVTCQAPIEVINVVTSTSLYQIWVVISVNGFRLNNIVDVPINVSRFNAAIPSIQAVDLPDNGTINVDDCLKVYVSGLVSKLDWDKLSLALTAAYSGNASVKILQTSYLTSTRGETFTEIRAVVKVGDQVVVASTLPAVNVTSLTLKLRNNSTFVSNLTSLELYPKGVQYSIALSSPIMDVDFGNVTIQLAKLYQNFSGYANSNITLKILSQQESVTLSGATVFLCSYVVLVNGIVKFEPSWVNELGVVSRPSAASIITALSAVQMTADNVTSNYSSTFISLNEKFISDDALVKIPFTNTIDNGSYVALSSVLYRMFLNISSSYSGFSFIIVNQEEVVDSQGAFFSYVSIAIQKPDGSFASAIDLPGIDLKMLASLVANVVTPSGLNLTVVDLNVTGPLLRYSLGWNIYLNQVVATSNISSVLSIVQGLLPPGLMVMFGAQDKVVDQSGVLSFKVTFFVMRGTMLVDARRLLSVKSSDLASQLANLAPGLKITASGAATMNFLSLRRSQKVYVNQFIASASVGSFLAALQGAWSAENVAPNFFVEEFVGTNGQTVCALSYFLKRGGAVIDSSVVRPLSVSRISSLLLTVTGGNYSAYADTPSSAVSYGDLFKLYIVNSLDADDARSILTTLQAKWAAYFGSNGNSVRLNFIGTKKSFGQYGITAIELLYQVYFNGYLKRNGEEVAPALNKTDIETVVPAVSVYDFQLPKRRDYLFSLILEGIPQSRDVIKQQLSAAWTAIYGTADIQITGIENRVRFDGDAELTITFVYYVVYVNGLMVSKVDVTPPTSFGSLIISSVSASSACELQSIQVNGLLLSADNLQKVQAALTQAWIDANPGLSGTFVIRISKSRKQQPAYVSATAGYAVRLFYSVRYDGVNFASYSFIVKPSVTSIDTLFSQYSLSTCRFRVRKYYRLILRGSRSFIDSQRTTIVTSITRTWRVKYSSASVFIRSQEVRNKRQADPSSGSNSGETPVEVQIDILPGIDPPDDLLGDDLPSVANITAGLASDNITCTNCASPTCSQFAVMGASSAINISGLQMAIAEAYVSANSLDSSTSISVNATTSDLADGSSCVSFCVLSNATLLDRPSDNFTNIALSRYGLAYRPSYGSCVAMNATVAPSTVETPTTTATSNTTAASTTNTIASSNTTAAPSTIATSNTSAASTTNTVASSNTTATPDTIATSNTTAASTTNTIASSNTTAASTTNTVASSNTTATPDTIATSNTTAASTTNTIASSNTTAAPSTIATSNTSAASTTNTVASSNTTATPDTIATSNTTAASTTNTIASSNTTAASTTNTVASSNTTATPDTIATSNTTAASTTNTIASSNTTAAPSTIATSNTSAASTTNTVASSNTTATPDTIATSNTTAASTTNTVASSNTTATPDTIATSNTSAASTTNTIASSNTTAAPSTIATSNTSAASTTNTVASSNTTATPDTIATSNTTAASTTNTIASSNTTAASTTNTVASSNTTATPDTRATSNTTAASTTNTIASSNTTATPYTIALSDTTASLNTIATSNTTAAPNTMQTTMVIVIVSVIGGLVLLLFVISLAMWLFSTRAVPSPPPDAVLTSPTAVMSRPPPERNISRGEFNVPSRYGNLTGGRDVDLPQYGVYSNPSTYGKLTRGRDDVYLFSKPTQNERYVPRGVFNQPALYGTQARGRGVYVTRLNVPGSSS